MTIAEISLSHSSKDIADEQLAQLNASVIFGPGWKRSDDGTLYYWSENLVHLDTMPRGIEFTVKRIVDHPAFESLEVKRNPAFNQKVKVSVPDVGLMKIKHVEVWQDLCTEMLQNKLNEGWCILAVCPQPDQRRPDYILGRVTLP